MPLKANFQELMELKRAQISQETASCALLPDEKRPKTRRVVDFIDTSDLLTPQELAITNSSASKILQKIKEREWTCLEVTSAFCRRASLAHQLVNCITEPLFKQARARASELDAYYSSTGNLKGPLHGLPFSLKDEFDLEGVQTTLCLVSRVNCKPAKKTSPNIKILIDAGAIPICKTTTPIGAFNIETFNNLFGKTLNPFNTELSPGGSTGGEAALVALRGSPLGVGSDLGGSIRQPASFNGLYGLRMSTARTTHANPEAVVYGMESLKATNGPLANDLDTLELYAQMMANEAWMKDINVLRKPWTPVRKESLTLAIVYDDSKIVPTAPITIALKKTARALEMAGHTVLTWSKRELLVDIAAFADIFMASNGFKKIVDSVEISGEEVPGIENMRATNELGATDIWELQERRSYVVNKFWGEWLRLGIDAIVMPVTSFAGVKFGEFMDVAYSPLANVLDLPACAFPVMTVNEALTSSSGSPRQKFLSLQDKGVHDNFNADDVRGMFASLQVLGPRLEEELVLHVVATIQSCLGNH